MKLFQKFFPRLKIDCLTICGTNIYTFQDVERTRFEESSRKLFREAFNNSRKFLNERNSRMNRVNKYFSN